MLIRRRRGWEIPEREATPEHLYLGRRRFLSTLAAGPILAAGTGLLAGCEEQDGQANAAEPAKYPSNDPTADLYPAARNERYALDRPLTGEEAAITYNNYYEFGSHKNIWEAAQQLSIRPWSVTFDGLVEEERTLDVDSLIRAMPLEERLYRLRCVEAWSMAVPWTGFALAALVDYARPLGSAKYLRMETFLDPGQAPGQKADWYPWPYVEGLTMAEARNELAFIATGIYGKPMPKQNGSPLRLAVPWKYGFKSIKGLVRFTFTEERPVNFWQVIQPREYGFWANVNPEVPHPRWSQRTEKLLADSPDREWERRPTLLFNGYGKYVAGLYSGLEAEPLFM